jgi:hypothetical protein
MTTTSRFSRLSLARLRRFLADRQPVTLGEAAHLLGCDASGVASEIGIDVPDRGERIPWGDVVDLLRQMLTPEEFEAAAGNLDSFPELLRATPVVWSLPGYLLTALERAAAEERCRLGAQRLTVEAYVAEQLERIVAPAIFIDLCRDPLFRKAFRFPEDDEDLELDVQ